MRREREVESLGSPNEHKFVANPSFELFLHIWRILAFWGQFAARNFERNFPQLERNFPQPSAISKSVSGSVVPPPKARKDIQVCENEYVLSTVHTCDILRHA